MELEQLQKVEKIALEIIDETIKDLLINYKFLDLALSTINFRSVDSSQVTTIGTDGKTIYYNSLYLIEKFKLLNSLRNPCLNKGI